MLKKTKCVLKNETVVSKAAANVEVFKEPTSISEIKNQKNNYRSDLQID